MLLADLELFLVELSCRESNPRPRSLLVRLVIDGGVEGWGEAAVAWRPDGLPARRDALLAVLAGRSVFEIEELLRLESLAERPLAAALEMASWDAVGRIAGQPLCHLIGGRYRRRVPLAVRLPAAPPEATADVARALVEQGSRTLVVPASGEIEEDLAALRAVDEVTGGHVELRLDGNRRFDGVAAAHLCREVERFGLRWLLDPLATEALEPLAALQRQTNVPLAVASGLRGPADVMAVVRSGAAQAAVVDPGQAGGLLGARRAAAVAEAGRLAFALRPAAPGGVATAAMLHLAAATPSLEGAHQCGYAELQDDLLARPLELSEGMLTVPTGPGLGVEVDRARLERAEVRT